MGTHRRIGYGFTLLLLTRGMPLAAQGADTIRVAPHDTMNITVLDIEVDPNVNEPHVVFLQKHVVYRASFSEPGVTIRMRSIGGKQLPFVVPASNEPDASRGSEYEVYPLADGAVEFRALFNEEQRPVRFRIWSDAHATMRRRRADAEGWWELGAELVIGWHPSFAAARVLPLGSGPSLGACFGVRNGPGGLGRVNGCVLGLEWSFGEGPSPLFGVFTEPKIRIHGGGSRHVGWVSEEGILTRVSIYASRRVGWNFGTPFPALGVYVARDQRPSGGGAGWRCTVTGRMELMKPTREDIGSLGYEGGWRARPIVAFAVGRYF